MKFTIAAVLVLGSLVIAVGAAPAESSPPLTQWQQHELQMLHDSAPADEYFGKMKMSYLGMNNTFHDAAISSGDHTTDPRIVHNVELAEDALEDWGRKYPRDPQLARTYYLATVVERKIWLRPNQDHAWIYLNRLVKLFPNTYFGKLLRSDLAIGFTEHYYANPTPCAPLPPPVDEGIDAFYVPPAPVPLETPTPLPSPMATTLEPGLRVVVLPQACVPPASPAPR